MRTLGTVGEYTYIEDGYWMGVIDKNGKMLISPDLHYRTIGDFVDGVAIACQKIGNNVNLMSGLIDTEGNHISEFKYNFVEEWGEGYYKCEIGSKKNILRRDGTEVLRVWFNDVYKVKRGLFIIGNTIRKTKDHPTLYPRGLASVNGDILFPPMFNRLRWHDEVLLDFFYAEKDGKPYLIDKSGFIIDPAGDHLPKPLDGSDNFMWDGPKNTICDGCVFTDGINSRGEGCRVLQKEDFRNNVMKGVCQYRKTDEHKLSRKEEDDKYNEKKAKEKASKVTDVYATSLVKDFIKDKLDGDIMKLTSFDFNELEGDEKYGNSGGYAFSPEKTCILKAIMALTFKDAWPALTYDGLDHLDYEVASVNTYMMLLGFPLGDSFKALREFRPSADLLDRAWAFYRLCHTVGNYVVWPGGFSFCRDKLRRSQRYIDTYLQAIHFAFINPRKGNIDMLQVINKRKKAFDIYRSDEGFTEMCRKLMLGDYLDYMGKPMSLFYGVWSDQKDLTREDYFKAIEQYFDFCEEEIVKRTKLIVKRLMVALGMDSPIAEPEEVLTLQLPEKYEPLRSLPDDPEGALSYSKENRNALCFVQSYPIKENETMPMNDTKAIIDGIHDSLGDNQGLIEVSQGMTRYGKQYVFSIVKSGREPSGMNYILTMHFVKKGKALCLKGQFEERGTTGIRDTTVYEYARRQELVKGIDLEGWMKDPYDENYTRGIRMNLSERREYDRSFPHHPLSELRAFIAFIIDSN